MPNKLSGAPEPNDNGLPDLDLGETVYLTVFAEVAAVTDKIDKSGNETVERTFRPLEVETANPILSRKHLQDARAARTGVTPLPLDGEA